MSTERATDSLLSANNLRDVLDIGNYSTEESARSKSNNGASATGRASEGARSLEAPGANTAGEDVAGRKLLLRSGSRKPERGLIARCVPNAQVRIALFWCVCIWVRFGLSAAVGYGTYKYPTEIGWAVVGASMLTILNLLRQIDGAVWWSRRAHIATSCALLVAGVIVVVGSRGQFLSDLACALMLSLLFALDVCVGIVTRCCCL